MLTTSPPLAMEHSMRCNSVKCRRELKDQAVVTTCSHIFCLECANLLQISNPPPGQRPICPVCQVRLNDPDDAVIANLNPTEAYKTSVLSGLNPTIIMECAVRALSFWTYQTTQEIVYHDYVAKTLTDKYTKLDSEFDKVVHNANSEIRELRGKVANLHADQETLRRKNEDLSQAYKEKSRKHMQTQELYDKLKRRAMLGQVQDAASEAVDDSIQASVVANRFANRAGDENQIRQPPPLFSGTRANEVQQPMRTTLAPVGMTPGGNRGINSSHQNIFSIQESHYEPGPSATPSTHRQRLTNLGPPPTTSIGMNNQQAARQMSHTPSLRRRSPSGRSPLGGLTGNAVSGSGFAGYGMSAGVKYSQPPSRIQNLEGDLRQSSIPPRVAQRPASALGQGFLGNPNASIHNLQNTHRFY